MSQRRRAREVVLQVLYQLDLNPDFPIEQSETFVRGRLQADSPTCEFALELIRGVSAHRQLIDQRLATTSDNWRLNRMAATDRAILRLGAYEILWTETPDRVAINEAIELAKRFGTNQSAQFVNGVLDRFIHLEQEAAVETEHGETPPQGDGRASDGPGSAKSGSSDGNPG
ncbi:MAG: transcription antitermination factor NusB [Mariniblastus sp.]|nr:transcription antitermination factor NusB [Mariniblastus sp.]